MAAGRQDLVYHVIPRLACSIRDKERQEQLAGYHSNALGNVFDSADVDHNGLLNRAELRDILLRIQPDLTNEEMEALFMEFDRNRDGQVDFGEFRRALVDALTLVDQGLRWKPVTQATGFQQSAHPRYYAPAQDAGLGQTRPGSAARPATSSSAARPGSAARPFSSPWPDQAPVPSAPSAPPRQPVEEDGGAAVAGNSWVMGEVPDEPAAFGLGPAGNVSQPPLERGVSMRSRDALRKLGEARKELDMIVRTVGDIERQWASGSIERGAARTELAQLEAQAKQLETERLDNLYLSELSEYGKQQAKTIKKELLAQVGHLLEVTLPNLFERIPRK